jgi:hypothetical protein
VYGGLGLGLWWLMPLSTIFIYIGNIGKAEIVLFYCYSTESMKLNNTGTTLSKQAPVNKYLMT